MNGVRGTGLYRSVVKHKAYIHFGIIFKEHKFEYSSPPLSVVLLSAVSVNYSSKILNGKSQK